MAANPLRLSIDDFPAHLANLEAELASAGKIELLRGDLVIAELRPPSEPQAGIRPQAPDFMARMKARWGDRRFSDSTEWIRADRDAQL